MGFAQIHVRTRACSRFVLMWCQNWLFDSQCECERVKPRITFFALHIKSPVLKYNVSPAYGGVSRSAESAIGETRRIELIAPLIQALSCGLSQIQRYPMHFLAPCQLLGDIWRSINGQTNCSHGLDRILQGFGDINNKEAMLTTQG